MLCRWHTFRRSCWSTWLGTKPRPAMKCFFSRFAARARNMNMVDRLGRMPDCRVATLLCVLTLLVSCTTINYQGDGKFVDRGALEGTDRYVVDLGAVDLGKTGQYKYSIGNLPPILFGIGLEIAESQPNFAGKRPSHGGRVRLLLETEGGQRVFSEDAPLDDWVWSFVNHEPRSFLYRAGTGPRPSPEQGSGSSFIPKSGTKYRLTLEVVEPQPSPRVARLLIKGGGWQ